MKTSLPSNAKLSLGIRKTVSAFMATVVLVSLIMISVLVVQGTRAEAAAASPVTLTLAVFKEKRATAADGTTRVELVPLNGAVPGDRLVYRLTYTNTGTKPVADIVLNYPMPEGVAYRASADGSIAPDVARDGDTVKSLSWRIPGEVAPGAHGEVSFKATLN